MTQPGHAQLMLIAERGGGKGGRRGEGAIRRQKGEGEAGKGKGDVRGRGGGWGVEIMGQKRVSRNFR